MGILVEIFVGLLTVVYLGIIMSDDDVSVNDKMTGWLMIACNAAIVGGIIYATSKKSYLKARQRDFILGMATLSQFKALWWMRDHFYFEVTITLPSGDTVCASTSGIYSNHLGSKYKLSEYSNKRVCVLYDQEKNKAYVMEL